MEENFSMEWNIEWKIFGIEWKKITSMEYGKIVFNSIPCPEDMCRAILLYQYWYPINIDQMYHVLVSNYCFFSDCRFESISGIFSLKALSNRSLQSVWNMHIAKITKSVFFQTQKEAKLISFTKQFLSATLA